MAASAFFISRDFSERMWDGCSASESAVSGLELPSVFSLSQDFYIFDC